MPHLREWILICFVFPAIGLLTGGSRGAATVGNATPTGTTMSSNSNELNVKDRGARGDGITLETGVIQSTIDQCSALGGGIVRLPAGRYLSGTLQIKDGVVLQLDQNATLAGSTNLADYRLIDGFVEGLGATVGYAFIVAVDAKHIGVVGPGEINGQGKAVALAQAAAGGKGWNKRPFLVRFLRCNDVTLKDVRLIASAAWTTHLSRCTGVAIEGLTIDSVGLAHNDGIDIDSCRQMTIRNTSVHSGDDAICFKTLGTDPCRDIVVTHCTLKSNEGAIKFGTESAGDFKNISVSDCQILGAHEGGIKLYTVDGSHMQNIDVSHIKMMNVQLPIMIRLGARLSIFHGMDRAQPVGSISDVHIQDVEATHCTSVGVLISGIPGHAIENVSLENIHLRLIGGGSALDAKAVLPENANHYPEVSMFGKTIPAYALYARHVNGLKIDGMRVEIEKADARPASYWEDLAACAFTNWDLPSARQ